MVLKAGQLIRNASPVLERVGFVVKVWQSKPEFVPQALVFWMYYSISANMVGQTTQIDTRQIYTTDKCDDRFRPYRMMQDETGEPAAPLK